WGIGWVQARTTATAVTTCSSIRPVCRSAAFGGEALQQRDGRDLVVGELVPLDCRRGPVPPSAVDDLVGGDDEVETEVVVGHGDVAVGQHLQVVDGGDHHGVGPDEPGLPGQGVLEVGEPAALAQSGAGPVHRDAPGDHEVH